MVGGIREMSSVSWISVSNFRSRLVATVSVSLKCCSHREGGRARVKRRETEGWFIWKQTLVFNLIQ